MCKSFESLKDGDLIDSFGDDEPILNKRPESKAKKRRWSFGPYVKLRDFNDQGRDEFICEDNPSHTGVEVGFKFTF